MNLFVVQRSTVIEQTVFFKRLSVIAGYDDGYISQFLNLLYSLQ